MSLQDDKNRVLPTFETTPLNVEQEKILGMPAPNYTATAWSRGGSVSGPMSSGHPAATVVPPLDMSCDTIYKVTVVLNLESDWKCPVVVTLTNATVASSEVTGSTSHKVKVINDHTFEVILMTENTPRMDVGDVGMASISEGNLVKMTDRVVELSSGDAPIECSDTRSDIPTACSDTNVRDYIVSDWKDDPNKDPDWDPEYSSDGEIIRKKKPAARKSSGSDSNINDTVTCQTCSFRTSSQAVLMGHVMKKHYEEASLSGLRMCRQCGKVEDSIELLQKHRQANHSAELEVEHKCPLCRKVFTSYYKYRTHVARHEHKHKCTKCKRAFLMAQTLRRHIGSVHRSTTERKHFNLVCEICGHAESKQKALEEHQTMKHGIDFGKRLSCSECDQVFQANAQLRNHVRWHHQLLKPLECDICGKFFKQEVSLRSHVDYVHLQTNLQACPHCGKNFATKSRLNMHVNNVHLKLRQLPCPWPGCANSFGSNWHLRVHMHIHNNEKPLGCPHCDFRARQRHALDYHLERHHKDLATERKKNKVIGSSQISPESTTSESAVSDQITPEQTINENTGSDQIAPEQIISENTNKSEIAKAETLDA